MLSTDAIEAIGLTDTAKALGWSKQRLAGRAAFTLPPDAARRVIGKAAANASEKFLAFRNLMLKNLD